LQVGLDKFIIIETFTGRNWRPLYVQHMLGKANGAAKRDMSTKSLQT
jgi:hypothetical protein